MGIGKKRTSSENIVISADRLISISENIVPSSLLTHISCTGSRKNHLILTRHTHRKLLGVHEFFKYPELTASTIIVIMMNTYRKSLILACYDSS